MDPILCSEEIIHLSKAESAALKRASAGTGDGVLMFMANAALEKIGQPGATQQPRDVRTAAGIHKRNTLSFCFTNDSGAETAHLNLDERQSGLVNRVVAATGLNWGDLFAFILDRQLEGFFPPGDPDVFSVRDCALREITDCLGRAQQAATALRAVTERMEDRLQKFGENGPLPARGFLAELPGLFSLIQHLSVRADVEVADAELHWSNSARPALLERPVTPVPIPLAKAAA